MTNSFQDFRKALKELSIDDKIKTKNITKEIVSKTIESEKTKISQNSNILEFFKYIETHGSPLKHEINENIINIYLNKKPILQLSSNSTVSDFMTILNNSILLLNMKKTTSK